MEIAAILNLSTLSPIEYDSIRKVEAERLNVRERTLDAEVKKFVRSEALQRNSNIRMKHRPSPAQVSTFDPDQHDNNRLYAGL